MPWGMVVIIQIQSNRNSSRAFAPDRNSRNLVQSKPGWQGANAPAANANCPISFPRAAAARACVVVSGKSGNLRTANGVRPHFRYRKQGDNNQCYGGSVVHYSSLPFLVFF